MTGVQCRSIGLTSVPENITEKLGRESAEK